MRGGRGEKEKRGEEKGNTFQFFHRLHQTKYDYVETIVVSLLIFLIICILILRSSL